MTIAQRPWLSVIFPVHNGERWVGHALDSLVDQADPGIEIVVIDTSAGPGTRQIIDTYGDRLTLRYVDADGAEGCSQKMNHGVSHAAADHVSWLCQDDVWLPGRSAAAKGWIEHDRAAALHLAPSAIIDRDGRRIGVWNCPLRESGLPLDRAELLQKLLVQNFVSVISPIVRRDAWLAVGGIDPALWYTGDWDLWIKLTRHGDVRFHDSITGGFRIHDQSATSLGSLDRGEFIAQHRTVLDRHVGALALRQAKAVRPLAEASVKINADLAAAAQGNFGALLRAAWSLVRLGPVGARRYLHYSRIVQRSLPRLRAKFAGGL